MKLIRSVPTSTLSGVVAILGPYVSGLTGGALVDALKSYEAGPVRAASPAEKWLAVREAAERLGISRSAR